MDINQKCDYCLPHEGPEKLDRIVTDNHPSRKVDLKRFQKSNDDVTVQQKIFKWLGFPQHLTVAIF